MLALLRKGKDPFDGDAHALLAFTYKDQTLPIELRLDAAKAAIGYERPRLQAATITWRPSEMTDAELASAVSDAENAIDALEELRGSVSAGTRPTRH